MIRSSRIGPIGIIVAIVALCGGCDNSFSPKAEFVPQLVVYGVLDASASTQMIRIERSYDAEIGAVVSGGGMDIDSAVVRIVGNGRSVLLHDTLVVLPDGTRRRMWVAGNLLPAAEKAYRLQVSVPGFPPVTGDATVPGRMYVTGVYVPVDTGIASVRIYPGVVEMRAPPAAWYLRLFVVLRKEIAGIPVEVRAEVPRFFEQGRPVYPGPARTSAVTFPVTAITRVHNDLVGADSVILARQLLIVGYGLENNFYSYYKVSRGFDDPVSMRLDQPDISFINGGLGVFGAVQVDSVRYDYNVFMRVPR